MTLSIIKIYELLLDVYFGDNDSILVLGDFCEENNISFQGLTNADVEESLCSNFHDHNGYGYGYGNGNGYGYGNGHGFGDGHNLGGNDNRIYMNFVGNSNGDGYGTDAGVEFITYI